MNKRVNGFTLIELTGSLAIVSVLASVAIPSYEGYVESSCMTTASNNLQTLRTFEEVHKLEYGYYVAGKHDGMYPDESTLESSSLKWKADDNNEFMYVVEAGSTGKIVTSYQVTITGTRACANIEPLVESI